MRIALCVRHQRTIFRLVWLNESNAGIYVGVLGSAQDAHVSYHRDGTRHYKSGSEYHNRFKDTPIEAHVGARQLQHASLSLTKEWFNARTLYDGDDQTESIVLLDQRLVFGMDTLALDIWLTDRASEHELLRQMAEQARSDANYHIVAELISALDYFPRHKVAFTLRAARVRDVAANQLMFVATGA